ncbi:MAG: glucose-6-phosphate dehydrogenase [Kordiimonadaceae bacterium]|nr:glucose-6-phosphate dehydrogenase [Kordiimonadaceae bacterium]
MLDIVIFGGVGDLALRKLLPSLYYLFRDGKREHCRLLCVSRSPLERDAFLKQVKEKLERFVGVDFNEQCWQNFKAILSYMDIELSGQQGWEKLVDFINLKDNKCKRDIIYYLSVTPSLFAPICRQLGRKELNPDCSRVVVEKPLGEDYESAKEINAILASCFNECQIYRIDHYLGKEAVQNILHLRFSNHLIETVWNNQHIDHVEITVSEQVGVESRAQFLDRIGTLRDMVQNHLMQLLTYITMETPKSLSADDIRDRKIEVINALQPITIRNVAERTVRAQYIAGEIDGVKVPGYLEELEPVRDKVNGKGETFVALKVNIDNGRWRGVPFILKTGKRMARRFAEIRVKFNPPSNDLYDTRDGNQMVIEIQPALTVSIQMLMKQLMGADTAVKSHANRMQIATDDENFKRVPEAYERLIGEVIKGNQTYFVRDDEIMASWKWIDRIRNAWEETGQEMKTYAAGTEGPEFDE